MASEEQMRQILEQLQAAQAEATAARQEAAAATATAQQQAMQQGQSQAAIMELVNIMRQKEQRETAAASGSKRHCLIDSKGLGKPSNFDGVQEEKAIPWLKKVRNFYTGVYPEMAAAMDWATEREKEIPWDVVDAAYGTGADLNDEIDDLEFKNNQLFLTLENLTEREPFDITQNVSSNNGLETWRRLHKRYDPSTRGRRKNLLKSILKPGRHKLENLGEAMEKWEEQVGRYERRKDSQGKKGYIPDDLKIAIVEDMVPVELETHLLLNADRIETYEECRREISSYIEAKVGLRLKEPAVSEAMKHRHEYDPNAMDCSSLHRPGCKAGRPQSRGPAGKFQGDCRNCGKPGHKAADCYAPGGGAARKDGGKGKDGKGKDGKGKGKGKFGKGKYGKGKHGKGGRKGIGALDEAAAGEEEKWSPAEWEAWNAQGEGEPEGEAGFGNFEISALAAGSPAPRKEGQVAVSPAPKAGKGTGKAAGSTASEQGKGTGRAAGSTAPERGKGAGKAAGSTASEQGKGPGTKETEFFYIGDAKEKEEKKKGKKKWHRVTYDTGAAPVAFPMSFQLVDETEPTEDVYKTACGEMVPDEGGGAIVGWNAMGRKNKLKGRRAPVHKILAGGHKMAQAGLDSWLNEQGGWLMPRNGIVGKKMRAYFKYLTEWYGHGDMIPIYVHGGVYCFDLFTDAEIDDENAVEIGEFGQDDDACQPCGPGFHRPAKL